MIDPTELYLVAVGALLLVALGAAARVLAAIYREGRDRIRRRRREDASDADAPDAPDADPDPPLSNGVRDAAITCPQCGAENAPEFTYCSECVAPLGPDG